MKTKYIIISLSLIAFMGFWMIGGSLMNSGINPIGLLGVPMYIVQSFQGEDNPCQDISKNHRLVDGQCKLPESMNECQAFYPHSKVKFIDNECILLPRDSAFLTVQAFDVKVTGTDALQICNMLELTCSSEHEFDGLYLPTLNITNIKYIKDGISNYFQIKDGEICHQLKEVKSCVPQNTIMTLEKP